MRDQYAGDVSDFLKFALLRALAGEDRKLGIAWYYAPDNDGRPDGRHLEWRDEPAWRDLDGQLYAGLSTLSERSVAALERAAIWPEDVVFFREPMPRTIGRSTWCERQRLALGGADIVFLDPDNGLGNATERHATLSEVEGLRKPGRVIVFITFPGRNAKHDELVRRLHDRLIESGAESALTLRTTISVPHREGSRSYAPRTRWFTAVDADALSVNRARAFATALASIPRVRARLDE
jgi:hypothetical protein